MALRFLIVDDSKAMQAIVRRIVVNAGFPDSEFLFADNGLQALTIIEKESLDMVLLDWHMPEMNGLQLLQKIKAHNLDVRVGLVTAERDKSLLDHAIKLGARFVVNKPFTVESIQSKLLPALSDEAIPLVPLEEVPEAKTQSIILPPPSMLGLLMSTIIDQKIQIIATDSLSLEQITLPARLALYGDSDGNVKALQIFDSNITDKIAEGFASTLYRDLAYDDELLEKSLAKALSISAACLHNVQEHKELTLIKSYHMPQIIEKVRRIDSLQASERLNLKVTFEDGSSGYSIIALEK